MPFQIETVTAFVAIDKNGDEGVMGAQIGNIFYPLICADEARIAQMFERAEDISAMTGLQYRVIQFTAKTDVTAAVTLRYKKQ